MRPIVTGEWRSIPAAPAEGTGARLATRRPDPGRHRIEGPAVVVDRGVRGQRCSTPCWTAWSGWPDARLRLLPVPNDFFGGNVAVAGLMVGDDVTRALRSRRRACRRLSAARRGASG